MSGASIFSVGLGLMHLAGFICSLHALFSVRTPQGAIAWLATLNTMPILAVPAYLIFGRSKFKGYIFARQTEDSDLKGMVDALTVKAAPFIHRVAADAENGSGGRIQAVEKLAKMPFVRNNHVELLINGHATFDSIFAGIDEALDFILIQFYIVHDDEIGRELKNRLLRKSSDGVRIFFLYDEIGCNKLPAGYIRDLRDAGIRVRSFHTTRGPGNRFQLNFRNHRKIVVADGHVGWVGGHNVGDEYLGRNPRFGEWRDTHLKIVGPAVLSLQLSFLEDWNWATGERLELHWDPVPAPGSGVPVLILPSGPADTVATASLMFQHAIHSASQRIWIASPYFVPDEGVLNALQIAQMRGVDVRILIPDKPDHLLVYMSAFAFMGKMLAAGIRIYRYYQGFMHQKVFLVDDRVAAVGTVNLDNRSFRLNFEITAIILDSGLTGQLEQMLTADFEMARQMTLSELEEKAFWFMAAARAAYLTAPLQ
ncbi:MAG: cardiolipin synthase [Thermodesulfobacteriota bacterium]